MVVQIIELFDGKALHLGNNEVYPSSGDERESTPNETLWLSTSCSDASSTADTYDLSTEISVTFVLDVRRHGGDEQRHAKSKEARDGLHLLSVS
jgi:hypothetical protein